MPILYSFRRCPYAMRARMALLVSGAPFELREVALRDKPAAMIAASPKATVPVLVLEDGAVIDESIDIMRWALRRNDPEDWLAGDDADLIERFDDRFKHHLDRYKYPDRHQADPVEHRAAGLALLQELEQRLATHANLCRDTRALADIAIMPFVRQFAAVDRVWFDAQPVPRVQGWLARHVASPLFDQAMLRVAPWAPDA
ncbi:MAG: Glutathione S-transferase, N-terminal domain [Sphingomonas bacterium]|uniref:glutathione S-transferase n=1 Tax=Sphingomonas bacterium TaxID=1895847 RepID=UPI00261F9942|nr:glutathione S-transferase [Sphingomonas bacterium]MDB5708937.1 Glutathione S-transferase, N-terminal domain [Sphingomonas bacterium]